MKPWVLSKYLYAQRLLCLCFIYAFRISYASRRLSHFATVFSDKSAMIETTGIVSYWCKVATPVPRIRERYTLWYSVFQYRSVLLNARTHKRNFWNLNLRWQHNQKKWIWIYCDATPNFYFSKRLKLNFCSCYRRLSYRNLDDNSVLVVILCESCLKYLCECFRFSNPPDKFNTYTGNK